MQTKTKTLTTEEVKKGHLARKAEIQNRLAEFQAVWESRSDTKLWEELVFCIFTANASAKMGIRSLEAVKPFLRDAASEQLAAALTGVHRFPNARSGYIVATREYLQNDCGMRLRERLEGFTDPLERRDWLAQSRGIKGLGYKEASHFLRNVGFRGYAILDKHILNSLAEIGVIEEAKPPSTRSKYLTIEERLRRFAEEIEIDFDELDLVLWSLKTGEVLK